MSINLFIFIYKPLCSINFIEIDIKFISVFLDCGFEVPDKFVVGYAIDYNEYFRDLDVSTYCFERSF